MVTGVDAGNQSTFLPWDAAVAMSSAVSELARQPCQVAGDLVEQVAPLRVRA